MQNFAKPSKTCNARLALLLAHSRSQAGIVFNESLMLALLGSLQDDILFPCSVAEVHAQFAMTFSMSLDQYLLCEKLWSSEK